MIALVAALALSAFTPHPHAADILARLDLSTFPNSTGPGHLPSPRMPSAAGFVETIEGESEAILRRLGGDTWDISLRVLEQRGDQIDVCLTDVAQNGGSYFVRTALTLRLEGGYYIGSQVPRADCPEWRARSDAAPPGLNRN